MATRGSSVQYLSTLKSSLSKKNVQEESAKSWVHAECRNCQEGPVDPSIAIVTHAKYIVRVRPPSGVRIQNLHTIRESHS